MASFRDLPQELLFSVVMQYFLTTSDNLDGPLSTSNLLRLLHSCSRLRTTGLDIIRTHFEVISVKIYHIDPTSIHPSYEGLPTRIQALPDTIHHLLQQPALAIRCDHRWTYHQRLTGIYQEYRFLYNRQSMCALAGQLGHVASTVATLSLEYRYSPRRSLIEYVAPLSIFVRGVGELLYTRDQEYGATRLLADVDTPCVDILDLAEYAEDLYAYVEECSDFQSPNMATVVCEEALKILGDCTYAADPFGLTQFSQAYRTIESVKCKIRVGCIHLLLTHDLLEDLDGKDLSMAIDRYLNHKERVWEYHPFLTGRAAFGMHTLCAKLLIYLATSAEQSLRRDDRVDKILAGVCTHSNRALVVAARYSRRSPQVEADRIQDELRDLRRQLARVDFRRCALNRSGSSDASHVPDKYPPIGYM